MVATAPSDMVIMSEPLPELVLGAVDAVAVMLPPAELSVAVPEVAVVPAVPVVVAGVVVVDVLAVELAPDVDAAEPPFE